jgi:hypothetical protein
MRDIFELSCQVLGSLGPNNSNCVLAERGSQSIGRLYKEEREIVSKKMEELFPVAEGLSILSDFWHAPTDFGQLACRRRI